MMGYSNWALWVMMMNHAAWSAIVVVNAMDSLLALSKQATLDPSSRTAPVPSCITQIRSDP